MPNYSHNKLIVNQKSREEYHQFLSENFIKIDYEKSKEEFNQFVLKNSKKIDSEKTDELFKQFLPENSKNNKEIRKLTFEGICPRPKEIIQSEKEVNSNKEFPDWYTWNIKNWGTKWDADTTKIEESKNKIIIYFDTAWAPPEEWLNKLASRYLNLKLELTFFEESGAFEGKATTTNGKWNYKIERPAKWVEEFKKEIKDKEKKNG